jgi:hypothetical protein
MKHLYNISSIIATVVLVMGLSFSASFAQDTSNYQDTSSYQDTANANNSSQYTLSGKVVSSQSQAVANANVTLMKGNKGNSYQNNTMRSDTTDTTMGTTAMDTTNNYNNSGMNSRRPMTATTDQNGNFKLQNIPSGTYT